MLMNKVEFCLKGMVSLAWDLLSAVLQSDN